MADEMQFDFDGDFELSIVQDDNEGCVDYERGPDYDELSEPYPEHMNYLKGWVSPRDITEYGPTFFLSTYQSGRTIEDVTEEDTPIYMDVLSLANWQKTAAEYELQHRTHLSLWDRLRLQLSGKIMV